jgi:hypothetical protein
LLTETGHTQAGSNEKDGGGNANVATVAAKIALMSTRGSSLVSQYTNGFEAPIEYSMRSGIKLHQVELEIFIAGQEKAYCKYALIQCIHKTGTSRDRERGIF